jgi:hypothetical protein
MFHRSIYQAFLSAGWALVLVVSSATPTLSQTTSCRAIDSTSARTVGDLKDLVTSSDSFTVRVRNALGLPTMQASKVSFVTDSRTCNSAVTALNTYFSTPGRSRVVDVYKIGTYYGVEDPTERSEGAYRGVVVYDSKWVYKTAWGPN